ncbi:MAG TPA: hypothetical protein VGN80_09605 [Devosiaceae bacterium]|jgi:hypothetical protein|nr:hypothetical protein [Devosiaceae bacterium]
MTRFQCEKIREHDDKGRLVKSGAEWREKRWWLALFGVGVFCLGVAGLLLAWMFDHLYPGHPAAFNTALLSSPLLLLGIMWAGPSSWRKRALIFHADGRMEMPYGLPYHPFRRAIEGHHKVLISIEQERHADHTSSVTGISTGGDSVGIAKDVTKYQALKVAVQLTRALNELRQDLASGAELSAPALPLRGHQIMPDFMIN